jgi:hypothetical protein
MDQNDKYSGDSTGCVPRVPADAAALILALSHVEYPRTLHSKEGCRQLKALAYDANLLFPEISPPISGREIEKLLGHLANRDLHLTDLVN